MELKAFLNQIGATIPMDEPSVEMDALILQEDGPVAV